MTDQASDSEQLYEVEEQESGFGVCSPAGRTLMVCSDWNSANHYVTLLNEAYRLGYKAGYRAHSRQGK